MDHKMVEYKNLSLEELLMHTHDHASWYWLGIAYISRRDFSKCIERCNLNYASDSRLKDMAIRNIDVLRRDRVKEI